MTSCEFLKIEEISGDFKRLGQLLILKAWIIFLIWRKNDYWKSFGSASKSLNQLKDHSLEISLFK